MKESYDGVVNKIFKYNIWADKRDIERYLLSLNKGMSKRNPVKSRVTSKFV